MTARLRSDIWVSAYLRRAAVEGAFAVLRRRGAEEAGAIYVVIDRLDGQAALFAPGPSDETLGERRWLRAHAEPWISPPEIEARLAKIISRDPDVWIVEVESRNGESWLDLAAG